MEEVQNVQHSRNQEEEVNMEVKQDGNGLRYDDGKPPISLVPPEIITALAEHYAKGAKKYQAYNWAKGMKYTRVYDSLMRHMLAWFGGEDYDKETGTHHAVSALWNCATLYWYHLKGVGEDDRPRFVKQDDIAALEAERIEWLMKYKLPNDTGKING